MTAATARDMLEALIWRTVPGISADHVDALLHAADKYANAAANHAIDRTEGRERLFSAAAVHRRGKGAAVTACRFSWPEPPPPARITVDWRRVTCGACQRSRGYKDQVKAA